MPHYVPTATGYEHICSCLIFRFQITPLTHSVLNVSKRVVVILCTMLYFRDIITAKMVISLAILIFGFVLYEVKLPEKMCRRE